MQGLILAAGMGKRLKELTSDNTKCMVKVDGITLIERALSQLDTLHLSNIIIVVGYEGKKLIDYITSLNIKTNIIYVDNPIYYKTNNIYSLALAKNHLLNDDTLLLESDLIFETSVLKALIEDKRETLALVDKYESWMDGTVVKLDEDDTILDFIPGKKFNFNDISQYYKTVNIYKFSKEFSRTHYVPFLDAYSKALGDNEYYEQVLRVISLLDNPEIKAKRLENQLWYEIDDIQDLDIATSLFSSNEDEKLSMLQSRYGGYWRYPKLLDFCYLVNPYFPPQKLLDELKSNFDKLITQYPSGMHVNSLLAAKNFGVHQEHIIVGNGAAELIKSIMENLSGNVGFIRPTFEEYPNRFDSERSVLFVPQNDDFSYTAEDLISFFDSKDISTLVLINPDNPSGNYIKKSDLFTIFNWSLKKQITIILDESFADFASDVDDDSLISEETITEYQNLIIIKSISKSYGVPGLRLGIAVTSDCNLISTMKNDVSIWNINSFAEFYLQIEEKYSKDYIQALKKFKLTRNDYVNKLSQIKEFRVIPSQANYIMIELLGGLSAKELTKALLLKHNILIKDLSSKIDRENKQFIRVAVKSDEENNKLIDALTLILSA